MPGLNGYLRRRNLPPDSRDIPHDLMFNGGHGRMQGFASKCSGEICRQAQVACEEMGATDKTLAKLFDVDVSSINYWKRTYSEFRKAVQRGRDQWDSNRVEKALMSRCIGYTYDETTIENISVKGKDSDGTSIRIPAQKVSITTKTIVPDVRAIIYWLEHRQPQRWPAIKQILETRGSMEHQHSGKVEIERLSDDELSEFRNLLIAAAARPAAIDASTTFSGGDGSMAVDVGSGRGTTEDRRRDGSSFLVPVRRDVLVDG